MKLLLITLLIFSATLLTSCGKESIGDTVTRERDLDRSKADTVATEYNLINGVYQSSTKGADLFLIIDSNRITKEGDSVPQPILVGTLVLSPRILVSDGQRYQITFPFSDGVYDKEAGSFSFTTEKEAKQSTVHCNVSATQKTLQCRWNLRASPKPFIFKKSSTKSLQALTQQKSVANTYVGKNDEFTNIVAEFDGGVTTSADSQIPTTTLLGHFVFTSEVKNDLDLPGMPAGQPITRDYRYSIRDGSYDILNDKLTITIDTADSIKINCIILDSAHLNCRWFSRHDQNFILTKQVKP